MFPPRFPMGSFLQRAYSSTFSNISGAVERCSDALATRRNAITNAASRSVIFFSCARLHTSLNAGRMIFSSLAKTSTSLHFSLVRPWIHSKYEPVTPPALDRMSGTSGMPRFASEASASGVVGPFAISTIAFARILRTFFLVSTPSSAAGISRLTFSCRSCSLQDAIASMNPGMRTYTWLCVLVMPKVRH